MNPRFLKPTLQMFPEPLPAKVLVTITTNEPGRVAFKASQYPAKLYNTDVQKLQPGQWCEIIGREGLTLLAIAGFNP